MTITHERIKTVEHRLYPRVLAGLLAGGAPADVAERSADGPVRIERALISVYDKTGLLDFARGLADLGVTLLASGGKDTTDKAMLIVNRIPLNSAFATSTGKGAQLFTMRFRGSSLLMLQDTLARAFRSAHGRSSCMAMPTTASRRRSPPGSPKRPPIARCCRSKAPTTST